LAVSGLFGVMVVPTGASAVTIGSVASSDPGLKCAPIKEALFIAQAATTSIPYTVPAGGGIVTSWSTSFGEPGGQLSLILVRKTSTPKTLSVVGSDTESLPSPIPSSHISTFTPASPIVVQEGDILGLQMPGESKAACFYEGGSADKVAVGLAGGLTAGSILTEAPSSPAEKILVNASATIAQSVDLGLSEAITPPSGPPGVALFLLTASNAGPAAVPATINDIVPNGLHVLAAGVTGGGECAIAGQAVTCQLDSVPVTGTGTPPVADIVVSSSTPGSYSNQASITAPLTDSNPANNTAGATLTVSAPAVAPPPPCKTIQLAGTSLAIAKLVIPALNCTVGKVTSKASKTVRKGLVISTSPGSGATLAAGTAVNVVVSSGPPKKKKKKKKKH
jgi:hypothetical protein